MGGAVAAILCLAYLCSQLYVMDHIHSLIPSNISPEYSISERVEPTPTIAYAVSLIKCSKKSSTTGFLDAAVILRHSIHRNSVRVGTSRYDYSMHAILHPTCSENESILKSLGYITHIVQPPVVVEEIEGEFLRNHIEGENCCGSAEFVKLHAYNLLEYPLVLHMDMDAIILKPLDGLYDAMLLKGERGDLARLNLEREYPEASIPVDIKAAFTRDYTSNQPWEPNAGVQGGFLLAKPDPTIIQEYIAFIQKGDYNRGRGEGSGWGGKGYGGFQGAMAYQGAVAYFYDHVRPNTHVELNVCRYNQVLADVIHRGPTGMDHQGECRRFPRHGRTHQNNTDCEDCRVTPLSRVYSAHYTACKKPWDCLVPHPRNPRDKSQVIRLSNLTNIPNCMLMLREWFALRQNFDELIKQQIKPTGSFEKEFFLGYCNSRSNYKPIVLPDHFNASHLYDNLTMLHI